MFFVIGAAAVLCVIGVGYLLSGMLEMWAASLFSIIAIYTLGMGSQMVYESKVEKLRERDALLDLIPWTGREQVLDVGCGRGLMLVGAAKRLTTGRAIGVDIWKSEDQSQNLPTAALANAKIEGVADRVEVRTADMRELPFADDSIEIVLSHWTVHNSPDAADRAKALAEIVRVMKPNGWLVLADIELLAEYAAELNRLGLVDVHEVGASWRTAFLKTVSFGSFCPMALVARKPYLVVSKLTAAA